MDHLSDTRRLAELDDRLDILESRVRQQTAAASLSPLESAQLQAFFQGALAGAVNSQVAPSAPLVQPGAAPQFLSIFSCPADGGGDGTVVRAFWWGFHMQFGHADLVRVLDSADTLNDLVAVIGGNIPSPAQPWIKLIAPFVSATHAALRGLDRGQGIYISMSWIAPGIFVPTSV